jgi:phage terminase small subunit
MGRLHKHFEVLYINKLHAIGKNININKARMELEDHNTYKPELSTKSEKISAEYRQKIAKQINEKELKSIDWLSATGNKDQWREHAKKIIEAEEMKECTFKP